MRNSSGDATTRNHRRGVWEIFRAPFWIGLFSIIGLIAALVGDGIFDGMSWLGLGIPVALVIWHGWWQAGLRK